ncbi:alpha/beta fold hydrolase [Herbiconiux daphne]|uniref:Alpha/beta hydrolase n=1 Tax=Herbiconiux daphne TaxID=2970914 RepID=A0ABT2H1J7_9MICO|nr:alpha/beta hydrolase [Herbiconiux daphne]MCS5733787.1 alpha/beta hydrolase [Herbiconiux daphne]
MLDLIAQAPLTERGEPTAPTALVLHGGGGPRTVAPIVSHLDVGRHVLAPTHPGWDGTPLPTELTSVSRLATAYLELLKERGEHDVALVGSSIGGWIALEMAVQAAGDERFAGLLGPVVVIDSVGIEVPEEPAADFFALSPRELAEHAWHDPDRGYIDPAGLTDEQRAVLAGNGKAMATIAGTTMSDPTLLARLGGISQDTPLLVVWGASDRIVTPAYGRALARAVPGAEFVQIEEAGHLPHLEAPEATWVAIDAFLEKHSGERV